MKITKMKTLWLQNASENCNLHLFIEREYSHNSDDLLNDLVYCADSRGRNSWFDSGNKYCPEPLTLTPKECFNVIRNSRYSPSAFYVMESSQPVA